VGLLIIDVQKGIDASYRATDELRNNLDAAAAPRAIFRC